MKIIPHANRRREYYISGEQTENEDGVDVGDIEVIMKQLHVDRNTAVKALKNTGDVVDAIFEISNK